MLNQEVAQVRPKATAPLGLLKGRNGVLHGEDLLDFLVIDDDRHGLPRCRPLVSTMMKLFAGELVPGIAQLLRSRHGIGSGNPVFPDALNRKLT